MHQRNCASRRLLGGMRRSQRRKQRRADVPHHRPIRGHAAGVLEQTPQRQPAHVLEHDHAPRIDVEHPLNAGDVRVLELSAALDLLGELARATTLHVEQNQHDLSIGGVVAVREADFPSVPADPPPHLVLADTVQPRQAYPRIGTLAKVAKKSFSEDVTWFRPPTFLSS